MNKQILLSSLQKQGFGETAAVIYLYLLENGPKTALEISRSLNLDRSKVYRDIERLLLNNALEQTHAAWGKKLKAAPPENLLLLLNQAQEKLRSREQALPSLIEDLKSFTSVGKHSFEVKHYRGQEGLRQMLWNQLAAEKKLVAFSYKNRNDIVGKKFAEKVRGEQVARKITLYEVENETDQEDHWYTDVTNWDKYYRSHYISTKELEIKQHIAVCNDTVSIINWIDDEQVGLEIVNSTFADTLRQMFWKYWEIASKSPG